MADKKRLPKGIFVKRPNEKAPDFVKANINIKVQDAIEFLQGESGEWVSLDLLVSKDNKLYLSVNDWKPKQASNKQDGFDDDIPF